MKKRLTVITLTFIALLAVAASRSFRADMSAEEFAAWQKDSRAFLEHALYNGPTPKPVALDVKLGGSEDRDGYTLTAISYADRAGHRATGYLALPRQPLGEKLPAVVALHGHGGSALMTFDPQGIYYYGDLLAQKGYIVLAIDIEHKDVDYTKAKGGILPVNGPWMGKRVTMVRRGIDYLVSRPDVDPQAIGIVGLSNGSLTSMFVSALDERVKHTVASGSLIEHKKMWHDGLVHCRCQYLSGIDGRLDYSDVFALIAPRPLVMQSGERDPIFPVESADRAFIKVKEAYTIAGAPDNVYHDVHDGKHEFRAPGALQWFDEFLPLAGKE